jgi:hypothetical protein
VDSSRRFSRKICRSSASPSARQRCAVSGTCRDALFGLEGHRGVSGTIEFDSTLNNVRKPWLAEVREGKYRYFRTTEVVGKSPGAGGK